MVEPERGGDDEAARDVQDPLGLKQSVFIATPIVMVRKHNVRSGATKNFGDSSSVISSPVSHAVVCGKGRFCKTEYNRPHLET